MVFTKGVDGTLSFTPEEVADGRVNQFISFLLKQNCEIRIGSDGYCVIVEYIEHPDGKSFLVVSQDNDEIVVESQYVDFEKLEADGKLN